DLGRRWGTATIGHDWDAGGRLTTQTVSTAAGVAQRRAYTYRADGLLTGIADALAGSRAFDLDPVGRITAVTGNVGGTSWTERYGYDSTGNITDAQWPGNDPLAGGRRYAGTLLTVAGSTSYVH